MYSPNDVLTPEEGAACRQSKWTLTVHKPNPKEKQEVDVDTFARLLLQLVQHKEES